MNPDCVDVMIAGLAIGLIVGLGLGLAARRPRVIDNLTRPLADAARRRFDGLPDPNDAAVRNMIGHAQWGAASRAPLSVYVLLLGTALLRARGTWPRSGTLPPPDPAYDPPDPNLTPPPDPAPGPN